MVAHQPPQRPHLNGEEVLDEWDRKGGDSEAYRKYISAVNLIQIDFSDTEGLGLRLKGWLLADEGGMRWLGNIGKFLGILAIAVVLSLLLSMILNWLLRRSSMSDIFRRFLTMLIRRGGVVAGFLVALTALEISLGPILALVGGASFVLAFALQSKIGNFASGIMLLMHRPFDVGDEIKVAGYWAFVDSISLANTKIKDFNNNLITLPNNTVWDSEIINYTHAEIRVLSFPIHVRFKQDLDQVYKMWMELALSHPKVLKDPEPEWFPWNEYFEYYIFVELMATTRTEDYWDVYVDLLKQLQKRVDELGIEMTAPQQDLNVRNVPPQTDPIRDRRQPPPAEMAEIGGQRKA